MVCPELFTALLVIPLAIGAITILILLQRIKRRRMIKYLKAEIEAAKLNHTKQLNR